MKANDIRQKTDEELVKELDELKKELFKLRFHHAVSQLNNPMKIKQVKRMIARVKTILRERELKKV